MKAIDNIVKVPVYDNVVMNPAGTAAYPNKEPDGYIDAHEYICPVCGCMLAQDNLMRGKYYCYTCKLHGIEAP